jgi:hypothetical protein
MLDGDWSSDVCSSDLTWRGITYEIRSRSDVRMVQYRPFIPISGEEEPASIT